jgi:hypothetical protein
MIKVISDELPSVGVLIFIPVVDSGCGVMRSTIKDGWPGIAIGLGIAISEAIGAISRPRVIVDVSRVSGVGY